MVVVSGLGTFASTEVHMILYTTAVGLLAGPIEATMYPSGGEVFEGPYTAELYSLFRFGIGLGALSGPELTGVIYDNTGSFQMYFFLLAVTYLISAVLYGSIILFNKWRPHCLYPESGTTDNVSNSGQGENTASEHTPLVE